jgi:ABC-type antimicrobial peptide transport system permease subunit
MVLSQGLRVAAIGVAAGITAALLLSRLLRGMLVGISSTDPLTFALVAAGLTLTALIACLVPALRATQVDPMVALRYE